VILDRPINLRVNGEKFKVFEKWCEDSETTTPDILREVIEAIPEGRVKIQKSEIKNQKLKELYSGKH
jgi:hypothetical protein